MKTGMSVHELLDTLQRIDNNKHDYIAPAKCIGWKEPSQYSVVGADGEASTVHLPPSLVINGEAFDIKPLAHEQICAEYGIGAKHYGDMLHDRDLLTSNGKHLWTETIRAYSQRSEKTHFIRVLDHHTRAFLSDRFNPYLDNYGAAQSFLAATERVGISESDICSCNVSDELLHIKVASPRLTVKVLGDVVQFGVSLRTSEVGRGRYSIAAFTQNLVCLNGMTHEKIVSRRHVGAKLVNGDNDEGRYVEDDTLRAAAIAKFLQMRDDIVAALSEHNIRSIAQTMTESGIRPVARKVDTIVEVVGKAYSLTEEERNIVHVNFLKDEREWNLWRVAQAITRTAHDVKDYDRASHLEATGWQLLNAPSSELKGVLA